MYSFSPESSEAFEGEVSCPRTHHLNNVPRLRGEKHDIFLKILHQAGFKTARQAATSAERHALTIAPCPSENVSTLVTSKEKIILIFHKISGSPCGFYWCFFSEMIFCKSERKLKFGVQLPLLIRLQFYF